ncbi:MAG: PEP-CTERM sorting domain-containing protein [Acidobacteriia bacterium]|nr:PEP-CTERM sorting domain-containing protein [Terriglobia bacterium]
MRSSFILFALAFVLSVSTAGAGTMPIPVCNTGVTADCTALNTFPNFDAHFSLVQVPLVGTSTQPAFTGPAFVTTQGFPLDGTAWIGNGPNSLWITPTANQADNVQASSNADGILDYVYETTFDLPAGFLNAVLEGLWSTDNAGLAIVLNGHDLGASIPYGTSGNFSFQSFTAFSAADQSFFVAGTNALDFVVQNGNFANDTDGPSGLRVEFTNATFDTPEPATAGLLLLGVPVLWFLKRKIA